MLVLGFGVLKTAWEVIVGLPRVSPLIARISSAWLLLVYGCLLAVMGYATFLLTERRARFVRVFGLQLVIFALMPLAELPVRIAIVWSWGYSFAGSGELFLRIVGHVLIAVILWS